MSLIYEEFVECPNCDTMLPRDWGWCSECGVKPKPADQNNQFLISEIVCPQCNHTGEKGRQFCGKCGTSLVRVCPACRTLNPFDINFCGQCGLEYNSARLEFIERINKHVDKQAVELIPTIKERLRYAPDDAEIQELLEIAEASRQRSMKEASHKFYEALGKTPPDVSHSERKTSKPPWWQFWKKG